MIIRCWGARGSIPVSGKEYLKYGGDTTCIEIRTREDDIIIIDAGSGIRKLGNQLLQEKRADYHMIFTHSHWDHILGFPFFKPIYRKETSIQMFGCPFTQESIKNMIGKVMTAPNFPIDFEDVHASITFHESCAQSFTIQSMTVIPIRISHPNQGMGYKFIENGRSFVFLTDNELGYKHPGGLDYQDYVDFSREADLLIHDAEFTEEEYQTNKTWGHSFYQDALRLGISAKVKKFGLFHHNQDRPDPALDQMVQNSRKIIKKNGAQLECFAVAEGMEIKLE
jgi:phosphoribosyl 1,2-cyclic phosphodiesterase